MLESEILKLLPEVKDELKITWEDEDSSLKRMIQLAKGNLDDLIGATLNLEESTPAKQLFLDYCRYDYNKALEYFEDNFSKEILRLQLKEGVKANVI